ncbi:MAG: acyltransferase [Candidatus Marinimicrobia bacterium]|jgi:peptidoglycan/LPS O-acetylase OafA/YrhL|nr:acyltransferase [Candidatus Neomarinimicrobiota bacterium]MBT3575911.1 acyltransferase [Candidatus Neomarinimicrobiota bacterium]MBT3679392.1 acyltransferase [Candidatus Neomarinimicrobiota bacterium]MBT3951139.1 acyltransferase [Candidatus Neomarinimicrobiota bacterium]MBT4254181.1 acyltransferase [Candidatus Neomarinimicrobiota bacterium]
MMISFLKHTFNFAEANSLSRNFGLDLIRAIAILLVVFSHGMLLIPNTSSYGLAFYGTGFLGVELFFVLSGYLIGKILLNAMLKADDTASFFKSLKNFWIRRWFRTLPNYYLFLLIGLAFFWLKPYSFEQIWIYFIWGQNLISPISNFMPETWSLMVEEWFYLTFPIALFLFARRYGRSDKTFLFAAIFYVFLFASLRLITSIYWEQSSWDIHLRKIVLLRLDAIAYGAIIMVLMKLRPTLIRKLRFILFCVGLMGITFSMFQLFQILFVGLPAHPTANHLTLTSISLALLLPLAVYQTETYGRFKFRSTIVGISIVSYAMYLLHYSVILPLVRLLIENGIDHWGWYVHYLLYWILCFLLSFLVYTLFERRMTGLREKYTSKG